MKHKCKVDNFYGLEETHNKESDKNPKPET